MVCKKYFNKYFSIVSFLLIVNFVFSSPVFAKKPLDWSYVKESINKDFPDVPDISTKKLSELLSNPDTLVPVLIDAREAKEYAMSHLKDAQLVDSVEKALEILKHIRKDYLIIIYCSVGYRSASLVAYLNKNGYKNVYNLEGSLFKWANEGRPLYKGNTQVKLVHPYNKKWSVLLKKELWSFTPEK